MENIFVLLQSVSLYIELYNVVTTEVTEKLQNNVDKLKQVCGYILYITAKNIGRNRGVWCSFHNTHQTFLVSCIPYTDHLCDSFRLTDVNPHFTAPGADTISK